MPKYLILLAVVFWSWTMTGCKTTYPEGSSEQAIKEICQKEYKVDVKVKSVGHTIGALVVLPHAIMDDVSLSDRAFSKLQNVQLTATRVTLSSAFQYDFFVISILDPIAQVEVSFVQYIKDIRRLYIDDISRNDYFQRMLIQTRFVPSVSPEAPPLYPLKDIQLKDFLAQQIVDRVKLQLTVNLIIKRLFALADVTGRYDSVPALVDQYPDAGVLTLQLLFLPGAPPFETMGTTTLRDNFKNVILDTVKKVYRRYEFRDCEGLRVVDNQGRLLASYDRQALEKGGGNSLMQLFDAIKKK